MDIQKEREAFEQALVSQKNVSINNLHVCTIFDAEKNKYSPSDVCDPKEDFIVDWINSSWSIWQAAKAQAVPDLSELQERIAGHQYYHDEHGHMVVDMDDVVKEISSFDSCKAQAVPAWGVVVPQLSANYLFNVVPELGFKHQDEKDTVLYHLNYLASGFRKEAAKYVADDHEKQKEMIAQEPAND